MESYRVSTLSPQFLCCCFVCQSVSNSVLKTKHKSPPNNFQVHNNNVAVTPTIEDRTLQAGLFHQIRALVAVSENTWKQEMPNNV